MAISDGENVEATVINRAKLDKEINDVAVGIVGLANTTPASGAAITNTQALQNNTRIATGATESSPGLDYTEENVITDGDNLKTAVDKLDIAFNDTTGHNHDGSQGSGAPITGAGIGGVPLQGRFVAATSLVAISGTSSDVSSQFGAATPSTNSTTAGVVVNAPENKLFLRQATGTSALDYFRDANGNVVYGRLTEAASVWTLSFYVDIAGVETIYDFVGASDVAWYYQELFPILTNNQVYSQLPAIFGDTAGSVVSSGLRAGTVSVPSGVKTVTAPFSNMGTNNYAVTANLINLVDGSPQIQTVTVSVKNNDSFVADWAINTDSANYLLDFIIRDNAAPPLVGDFVVRSASVSLASGISTISPVFSSDIGDTSYSVKANLVNLTDASPIITPVTVTTKLSTGFTAEWSASTDSINYFLDYLASRNDSSVVSIQSGSTAIANGVATASIPFSSMGTTDYAVTGMLTNLVDGSPILVPVIVTSKLATSFTAVWSANTDSVNYSLDFVVRDNSGPNSLNGKQFRSASETLASGISTKAVVFSSDIGTTDYNVTAIMFNSTDITPQIQEIVPTAKSSTGCTFDWPANTDSANYVLEYIAVEND